MGDGTSHLLSLPEAVLREVISWSPDGATANTLLAACRLSRQQRRDPATAALLLLRCPCRNYTSTLISCSRSCGGVAVVVLQVLQLVGASPDSGGPLTAPPPLLQAALHVAVLSGDIGIIRALMGARQPPDINASGGEAAGMAIRSCWQTGEPAVLRTLLDSGADPCADELHLFNLAAMKPGSLPALQLLLRHGPADRRTAAITRAATSAVGSQNVAALAFLLALPDAASIKWPTSLVLLAAHAGLPQSLLLVLDLIPHSPPELVRALMVAANHGHSACARLLLDRGAGADRGAELALYSALRQPFVRAPAREETPPEAECTLRDMVRLLLRQGNAMTPAVHAAAEAAGHSEMLAAMLVELEAEAHANNP